MMTSVLLKLFEVRYDDFAFEKDLKKFEQEVRQLLSDVPLSCTCVQCLAAMLLILAPGLLACVHLHIKRAFHMPRGRL